MRFNPHILSSAAAVALTCVVSAAAYYYKSRKAEINEVMVFCKLQYNAYNCFDKLMSYIEAASRCVSVCMPSIHNPAIQGRLVELIKRKNIKVRIIIDRDGYNGSTDFFLRELIDVGAEIRCKTTTEPIYRMHHKFCLIDDKVLMTGTLNWGDDRTSDHWNYVYVTSKNQLVEPIKKEFYQMWDNFTTNVPKLSHLASQIQDLYDTDSEITDDCAQLEDLNEKNIRDNLVTPELYIM